MIDLFGRDEYALLGLASLLDIERIPYRRIASLWEHDQPLLVVSGGDLSAGESARIAGLRALVLNGGTEFAQQVFGAAEAVAVDGPAALPLSAPAWPAAVVALASQFGKPTLRIPRAPVCRTTTISRGKLLSSCVVGGDASHVHTSARPHVSTSFMSPAVAQMGACLWSAIDLGTAFANLLTEQYLPGRPRTPGALPARMRGAAEGLYYAAPQRLRSALQGASYAMLERRLRRLGQRASEYPIDATGWLLLELVKALIKRAAGFLVRIGRWPSGCRAAAVLTHDLEPRRYAYEEGLPRLLQRVAAHEHPGAIGVVASAGRRYLNGSGAAQLALYEVFCHGLDHRGERVWGRERVARSIRSARAALIRHLKRPVNGYRSPRLDRSPDLTWALDSAGFTYDSSYPDVDRENLSHYGCGVRINLPYRPLIEESRGRWRTSTCMELPLTAPDCIQPLFQGSDTAALRAVVEQKAAYIRATGGLHVALVHAGVFGPDDAARREAHLDFVYRQLNRPGTWFTGIEHVVDWWRRREGLRIATDGTRVAVVNDGPLPVAGAELVVERGDVAQVVQLPSLSPGERFSAPAPLPSPRRSAPPLAHCPRALTPDP